MGRLEKRLTELERKEREILLKFERLDMDMQDSEKDSVKERKVVLREMTDVKIRIRNLQRIKGKKVSVKGILNREETVVGSTDYAADQDVDAKDDNFDPKALKLNNNRPDVKLYPKVPLPHSQPNWDKVVRVGRRERPLVRLADWKGQFVGAEEEAKEGSFLDKKERSGEEFGMRREDFCQLDDLNCAPALSSSVPSSNCIWLEDMKLTLDEECLTKIKSTTLPVRKERQRGEGKDLTGQGVMKIEGGAVTKLTIVETKPMTTISESNSVISSLVVNIAPVLEQFRERLRRRLIVTKTGVEKGK